MSASIAAVLASAAERDQPGALAGAARAHQGASLRANRGQAIFYEADPADAVYVLLEGIVRTFVSFGEDAPEERTTLLLRAPAIFGDRDVLASGVAQESAEALTP